MRENVGYKILALVMAILLWAWVNNGRNPKVSAAPLGELTVEYKGLPRGYVVTDAPQRVRISASGQQFLLRSIDVSRLKAVADLSDVRSGSQQVKLDIMGLPQELVDKEVTLSPQEIEVKVETFKRKSLRIDLSLKGAPPLGYAFGPASADPPVAVVSGRSSLVDRVRRLNISVKPGAAQSQGEDFYPVRALDGEGNEVTDVRIEPSRVAATLELIEAETTKSVIVSPNLFGQPTYPRRVASVSVSPPAVTIFGKANSVVNVGYISTERVDISNATDSVVRTAKLIIPSGVRTANVESVRVVVRIVQ